jgi:hypothetical protein
MGKKLEARLEAAGWRSGDAADFLGLSEEERQLLDARVELARAVREYRLMSNITQRDLAERMNSTQPRIAKIEAASADVSFEQLFKALIAVGGRVVITTAKQPARIKAKLQRSLRLRNQKAHRE